jgi:hypothetical protein
MTQDDDDEARYKQACGAESRGQYLHAIHSPCSFREAGF